MNKEFRIAQIRPSEQEDMILEGYAAVYDEPTVLYSTGGVDYKEVIARGAFDGADMKDVCLKYNHMDSVPILARVRGGSLMIKTDEHGLFFRAKLFDTQAARDVYTLVKEGGLDKCSFAFSINDGGDEYDRMNHTRTIKRIAKMWDVSVVDIPAYDQTSVSARSWAEAEAEAERKASEDAELRKRLILRTYL